MKKLVPHPCPPGRYCGLCNHNVKVGGKANHPTNLVKPKLPSVSPSGRKTLPTCTHLEKPTLRVLGSSRTWKKCSGGYGSTTRGAEGLVCLCGTKTADVWRVGQECGEKCPGYSAPAKLT